MHLFYILRATPIFYIKVKKKRGSVNWRVKGWSTPAYISRHKTREMTYLYGFVLIQSFNHCQNCYRNHKLDLKNQFMNLLRCLRRRGTETSNQGLWSLHPKRFHWPMGYQDTWETWAIEWSLSRRCHHGNSSNKSGKYFLIALTFNSSSCFWKSPLNLY